MAPTHWKWKREGSVFPTWGTTGVVWFPSLISHFLLLSCPRTHRHQCKRLHSVNGTIRCRVHALLVQGHQPSRNSVLASVKASKHPNQWDKNRNHLRGADEFLGHWKLLTWANTKESCQTECRTRWYCTFGFQINSKSLLELSLCQILYVPNMGHTYKNLFICLKLKSWASYVFNCEIPQP